MTTAPSTSGGSTIAGQRSRRADGGVNPTVRRGGDRIVDDGRIRRAGRGHDLLASVAHPLAPRSALEMSPLSSPKAASKRSSGDSRVLERHVELGHDASGPGRHHEDPAAHEDGLADGVGDEQPGESLGQEQLQRLVVEALPGDLVDGPEGLVEQQHRRLEGEGPGQGAAHLHAARQRAGVVLLEAGQADHLDRRPGQLGPLPSVHAAQLGQQLDVPPDRPPRQEGGVLEHVAEVAAVDVDAAGRRLEQARGDAQQRRLAAAGGPDDRHELAGSDGERDLLDGAGAVGERHRDVVEGHAGGRDARGSRVRAVGARSDPAIMAASESRRRVDYRGPGVEPQRRGCESSRRGCR